MLALLTAIALTLQGPPSVTVASGRSGARIIIDDAVQSASVGRTMKYRVLLPDGYARSRERYPALYLLHGLGGDDRDWTTRTNLATFAARLRLVIVMPEGENAWYTNAANGGPRFEDYIATDLVQDVERKYRVVRARYGRAIAGLSMGGYGAMKIALRHPAEFVAAGSFSGAFRATDTAYDDSLGELKDQTYRIYGPAGSETRAANDVAAMASAASPAGSPAFYLDCGTSDPFLLSNRAVVAVLQARGFRYEYHELPGAHSWEYWNSRIAVFLPWVMRHFVSAE